MSDEVDKKITRILNDFDRWLALQVLNAGLKHGELPRLNDAMRAYFSDTRTAESKPAPKESCGFAPGGTPCDCGDSKNHAPVGHCLVTVDGCGEVSCLCPCFGCTP